MHHCPRCELRFTNDAELRQHLGLDHAVNVEALERYRYPAQHAPPEPDDAGGVGGPRRILVVANQTLGGDALAAAIDERVATSPVRVFVLAPATHSFDYEAAPPAGETTGREESDDKGVALARWRLRSMIDQLRASGVDAEGEIGHPDPFTAVHRLLSRRTVDEIIVSTLPPGKSHWLGVDLPQRLERRFRLPVTTVVGTRASA